MADDALQTTLGGILKLARDRRLSDGWAFLPETEELRSETPCLFVDDVLGEPERNERGIPLIAIHRGFPREGLDSSDIQATVQWAEHLASEPSDALLLESFAYYLKHDAFLPAPGAPPPPPADESMHRLDRDFYDALGSERSDTPYRSDGCRRGAIHQSIFCRPHHFESVKRKPCPFSHA